MNVYIDKFPSRLGSIEQIDPIILFAWNYLKLSDALELVIEFDYSLPKHQQGEADYEDDIATIILNGRIAKRDLTPTIFHELVHIKQMANNELSVGLGNEKSKWKGVAYEGAYYQSPWEEEAFRLEQHMMKLFEENKNGLQCNN